MKTRTDIRVQVCLTQEQLDLIQTLSDKYGTTRSTFIKTAIAQYTKQLNQGV